MPLDWRQFRRNEMPVRSVVDPRRRLRLALAGLVALLLVVFGRAVQIEVGQGAAFRELAVRPLQHETSLPGVRGRILARDGTVLACDQNVLAVAVHYRYLQEPPDGPWLRQTARARLTRPQRKDPRQVAAQEEQLCRQRVELGHQVAKLCGLPADQWDARARQVQARVERIIAEVDRRRQSEAAASAPRAGRAVVGRSDRPGAGAGAARRRRRAARRSGPCRRGTGLSRPGRRRRRPPWPRKSKAIPSATPA